jgi:hypothetical protein
MLPLLVIWVGTFFEHHFHLLNLARCMPMIPFLSRRLVWVLVVPRATLHVVVARTTFVFFVLIFLLLLLLAIRRVTDFTLPIKTHGRS